MENEDQQQSSRPFWSGALTFGLVSIPVNLYPANRSSRVSLRMIGPSGAPVSRRYYSPETGKELEAEDLARGYEWEDGRYILVSDEELERVAPEKSRTIDLRRFVRTDAIPPLFFERSYFLAPGEASARAYRLLASSMEETGRAGVATFVMRGKEYLVAIFAENGILRAEALRFREEIRSPQDVGLPEPEAPDARKTAKFEKAIAANWSPRLKREAMRDRKAERTLQLIERKRKKREDVVHNAAETTPSKVVDLLSVLKKSLAEAGDKPKGNRRATPKKQRKPTRARAR
ncbi:MAG: Ku protein [Bryobacteraceae bacterium]|nr:Ku protein [Bryobacteraceae bacterium]